MSHDESDLRDALAWLGPDELELMRELALAVQELGFTRFDGTVPDLV